MSSKSAVPPAELFDLTGKVALVTGGSRGLGREMALGFAAAGADVVVTSRTIESCEEVADQVRSMGRRALPVACHVGRWEELQGLVDAAYAEFGKLDVLVNNAGKSPLYPSLVDVEEWMYDSVFAVNLKGPFRLSSVVGARMVDDEGGSIINVSSIGSLRPDAHVAPYAAAKAGLNALTSAMAKAFGPTVRVNAILPGAFMTDVAKHWDLPAAERSAREGLALQRIGDPPEIVGAAVYLASDASSFTTGTLLRVDGGVR